MDKKQTITTERKIGKITYLVQALPSEKATDTIHKKICLLYTSPSPRDTR